MVLCCLVVPTAALRVGGRASSVLPGRPARAGGGGPSRRGQVVMQQWFPDVTLPGPLGALLGGGDAATMKRDRGWLRKVRTVSEYGPRVEAIEDLAEAMARLPDEALRMKTAEFRARVEKGETMEDLLVEAFAVVREASKRSLGLFHYDVQLLGGIALHEGKLAEMATGEGKTLVATLPLYLRALTGKGAHLITVNDYLARRDAETLSPLFNYLGMTVGVVQAESTPEQRVAAYSCDVTYVTNNELGFDYLRDHICYESKDLTATVRGLSFCIVDEADSILIDEARTPLIISGEDESDAPKKYEAATEMVRYLERGRDYEVDQKGKRVTLTDGGYRTACELLGVADDPDGLYALATRWAAYVNPALCAKELYIRERDYIINKLGEVMIVDEFTGRVMEGRRWNNGLHQAVEAKEKVKVRPEQRTVASITYQSLFKLYGTLSGMTGTAYTERFELDALYNLKVLRVPTAKPLRRIDEPDLVFPTKLAKFRFVRRKVNDLVREGRPVLVGTTSIEDSALVSELLENDGVKHRVLNAKPDVAERESEIISQAGRLGAVTIATNMAGRGTDILLGGNAELVAKLRVRQSLAAAVDETLRPLSTVSTQLLPKPDLEPETEAALEAACVDAARSLKVELGLEKALNADGTSVFGAGDGFAKDADDTVSKTPQELLFAVEEYVASSAAMSSARATGAASEFVDDAAKNALGRAFDLVKSEYAAIVDDERQKVRAAGGLAVLGTERHESRRIDKQLRGRAGRQGDAGESVFAISLEDKMFNVFDKDKMGQLRVMFNLFDSDEPLSSDMLSKSLETIQTKVEAFYEEVRTNLVSYDSVVDAQRRVFYARRMAVLKAPYPVLQNLVAGYVRDTANDVVANYTRTMGADNKKKKNTQQAPLTPLDVANAALGQLRRMFPGANAAYDAIAGGVDVEDAAAVAALPAKLVEASVAGLPSQLARIDAKGDPNLAASVLRYLVLREFDRGWKDYIADLETLRGDIGYAALMQRDPLQEWTIKSNDLFKKLSAAIYRYAAIQVLSLDPSDLVVLEPAPPPPGAESQAAPPPLPGQPPAAAPPILEPSASFATAPGSGVEGNAPSMNRAERRANKKVGKKKSRLTQE